MTPLPRPTRAKPPQLAAASAYRADCPKRAFEFPILIRNALVAALRSGQLAGAGLDVTDPEPLPDGHALWSMPNVIITPHVAAQSDVQDERYAILVAENLRRYAAGEPLLNVVDIARGY